VEIWMHERVVYSEGGVFVPSPFQISCLTHIYLCQCLQLGLTHLKMELDAYKEPFMYQHGKACPTADKAMAAQLGKKPALTRLQRC